MKSLISFIFCMLLFFTGTLKAQDDDAENPQPKQHFTQLAYRNFNVIINDFNPVQAMYGKELMETFSDTSELQPLFRDSLSILKARKDTIHLEETVDQYFRDNLLQLVPKSKQDVFKVSFCYNYRIYEPYIAPRNFDEWEKNQITTSRATAYERAKDSATYFFRVPQQEENNYESLVKKQLNLRDTLVRVLNEFPENATLIYKNKPCVFREDSICIRIQKYVGDKLKETKYIIISFDYYG